jgi:hypothetical protein
VPTQKPKRRIALICFLAVLPLFGWIAYLGYHQSLPTEAACAVRLVGDRFEMLDAKPFELVFNLNANEQVRTASKFDYFSQTHRAAFELPSDLIPLVVENREWDLKPRGVWLQLLSDQKRQLPYLCESLP